MHLISIRMHSILESIYDLKLANEINFYMICYAKGKEGGIAYEGGV